MKLNIVVCDRCGAEIEPERENKISITQWKHPQGEYAIKIADGHKTIDLCESCGKAFVGFLRREENERV